MNLLFALLLILSNLSDKSQSVITGSVCDTGGQPLEHAILKAYDNTTGKMVAYALSDSDGNFYLKLPDDKDHYRVECSFMGFKSQSLDVVEGRKKYVFRLVDDNTLLKEVTVKAPPINVRHDTLVYAVESYRNDADRNLLDVIRKLPGITVDGTGTISYQNEPINKFYIEDLDMLGGQYNMAAMNLNPEDVASVSVYEHHQPDKVLQGLKESKSAALNIRLAASHRNRMMGNLKMGAGLGSHADFLAEAFLFSIGKRNQQLLTLKSTNYGNSYAQEFRDYGQTVSRGVTESISGLFISDGIGSANIPQHRYDDNSAFASSGNHLIRTGQDASLRLNTSVQYDRDGYHTRSDQTYAGTDEQIREERHDHNGRFQFSTSALYDRNSNLLSLKNKFSVRGNLQHNRTDVSLGNVLQQKLKMDYFNAVNQLNVIRRKESRLIEISSLTAVSLLPTAQLDVAYKDTVGLPTCQTIGGMSVYNKEQTELSFSLDEHWMMGCDFEFEILYDNLHTDNVFEPIQVNDMHSMRMDLAGTPYVRFRSRKLMTKVCVPVNLVDMSITDNSETGGFRNTWVYLSPKLNMSWQIAPGSRMMFEAGERRSLGDLRDFMVRPVMTSYRMTQVWGAGQLGRSNVWYVSPTFAFRNAMKGLFLNTAGSYQHEKRNRIVSSTVSGTGEEQVQCIYRNNSSQWSAESSVSKKWYNQNMLARLDVNTIHAVTSLSRQQVLHKAYNHRYSARLSLVNDWFSNRFHSVLSGSYTCNDMDMEEEHRSVQSWNSSIRFSWTPIATIEVYTDGYFYWSQPTGGGFVLSRYFDGGVRCMFKHTELELSVKNFTNAKCYTTTSYLGPDEYHYQCYLRPLECLFSVKVPVKW